FWSTSYSRFEQVPVPRSQPATQQNPSLILDYDRFMSDTNVDFVHEQAAILRRFCGKKHWITTNLYPSPLSQCIDMKKLFEPLDIAAYDNYPVWGDQSEPVPYIFTNYALAYTRGLKSTGNFAIMEQFTGIQGHTKLGYLPPPEQVVLWTNQAVAHGADRLFYFRWRTAPFAQEQLCYGIFDTDNEDTPRSKKIKENIEHTAELFNSFAGNPVSAQACLVYTRDNANLIRQQPLSTGLENWMNSWSSVGFDAELARWYAGFSIFNVEADVKPAEAVTLQNYKLISLPLYELADPAFAQKIDAWVKDGGVLVLGWRAGARTLENWNIDKPLPGIFSEMAGVQVEAFEALGKGSIGVRRGFLLGKGEVWAEQLIPYTAEVIARYGGTRW
ncbi:MAG TPA: beta-galactosidase, partial [Spirochaetales bacterium]|nr:beta-galactosidase [Spirochaetales bacterium]